MFYRRLVEQYVSETERQESNRLVSTLFPFYLKMEADPAYETLLDL